MTSQTTLPKRNSAPATKDTGGIKMLIIVGSLAATLGGWGLLAAGQDAQVLTGSGSSTALIQSQGDVTVLEETLLVRGLFSPLGHASWTGLVCATLWQERLETNRMVGPKTVGAFFTVVALHFLWDVFGGLSQPAVVYSGFAVIGGTSLFLLLRKYRQARRFARAAAAAPVMGT